MRILFSSTRGAGHLQPLLPYARALLARGHEVMVAGPAALAAPLREAGLQHAEFDHPGDEALAPIWARFLGVSKDEANAIALREIFAGVNARKALPKLLAALRSWRPDLIVRESVEFAALVAAAVAGVPHARVAVHMVSFEDSVPRLAEAPLDDLCERAGLPSGALAALQCEPVFCQFPASLDGPSEAGTRLQAPFRSRSTTAEVGLAPVAWAPPDDTRALLYITLGTLAGTSPEGKAVFRSALEAVAELPVRALLTTGRDFELTDLGAIPANVFAAPYIPQDQVLPRAAAILCHGGSGTMLGALAAAVPMVIVPMFADQPYNARRVAALGAGLALFEPDLRTVRAAIERVLGDDALRDGARRMAAEIAAMPALESAVDAMVNLGA